MIYSYRENERDTTTDLISSPKSTARVTVTSTPKPTATATPKPTATPEPVVETDYEIENQTEPNSHAGLDPAFKAMMDSYEAFFDEYIAFMENYDENGSDLEALMDYFSMLERYAEMLEAMDAIDEDSLSDAELAYYLEVSLRIDSKLLAASYDY